MTPAMPASPAEGPRRRIRRALRLRMENFSMPEPMSGCTLWIGCVRADGYGKIRVGSKSARAHVVAWEMENGPVPAGLVIDHLCRNRQCVNPAHMEPVTNVENVMRGQSPCARHARKTACQKGHPYRFLDERRRRRCGVCDSARMNARWRQIETHDNSRRAA